MSAAISRIGSRAAVGLALLLGCSTDTRIEYQHDPTVRIATDHALTRPELRPFTVDGVVVAPNFRAITHESTQLWLTLWAPQAKTVSVRAVRLAGATAPPSPQFPEEKTVTTDTAVVKDVHSGKLLLGTLDNEVLTALAAGGSAKLTVELRVHPAADYHTVSFDITRHKTKVVVTY